MPVARAPLAPIAVPAPDRFAVAFPTLSKECRARLAETLRFNAERFAEQVSGSGAAVSDEMLQRFSVEFSEASAKWPPCNVSVKGDGRSYQRDFGGLLAMHVASCAVPKAIDGEDEATAKMRRGQHALSCFASVRDVQMQALVELYKDTPASKLEDRSLVTRLLGGSIQLGAGNAANAERTRELALRLAELSPDDLVARRLAAQAALAYARRHPSDKSAREVVERQIEQLENMANGDGMIDELKMSMLLDGGDWAAVEEAATRLRTEHPNSDVGLFYSAEAKMRRDDRDGARRELEQLVTAQPGNSRAQLALERLSDPKNGKLPAEQIFPHLSDVMTFEPVDLTSVASNSIPLKPDGGGAPSVVR
jgi:predicted Zn-dependent protease